MICVFIPNMPIMKTFYTIASALFIAVNAFAQQGLELSIGPSFTNVSVRGLQSSLRPDRTLHTGLQVQALWDQDLGSGFSMATGLGYKEKGFHVREGIDMDVFNLPVSLGVEAITTLKYLELPLQWRYHTQGDGPLGFFVFAGPALSYALEGEVRTRANLIFDVNLTKTKLNLDQDIYNRMEWSGLAGVGGTLRLKSGALTVQAGYQHGFSRVVDNTLIDLRLRNYGFGMNIGYRINL